MRKPFLVLSTAALALSMHGLSQAQSISPQQAYKDALAQCEQMTDAEAKHNCKRDAGAAFQQAKRQPQAAPNEQQLQRNRLNRCDSLSGAAKQTCVEHMSGHLDTQEYGSVSGGGILRKSTIEVEGTPRTETRTRSTTITPNTAQPNYSQETTPPAHHRSSQPRPHEAQPSSHGIPPHRAPHQQAPSAGGAMHPHTPTSRPVNP